MDVGSEFIKKKENICNSIPFEYENMFNILSEPVDSNGLIVFEFKLKYI